jgi:hypothetical protein
MSVSITELNITELIWQKTQGKSNQEVLLFWKAVFPLKAYPPYKDLGPSGNLSSSTCDQSLGIVSDLYGFLNMWPVFRHCFRLLLWKMREIHRFQWDDSGHFHPWARHVIWSAHFLFTFFLWRSFCPVEILLIIYDKNNLKIDFKHRLTCFYYLLLCFFYFSRVLIVLP